MTHCTRCSVQLTEATGQVRSTCLACNLALRSMHVASEYTFFNRVYYIPEQEGTSLEELLSYGNMYKRDIVLPSSYKTKRDQVKENTLVNTS